MDERLIGCFQQEKAVIEAPAIGKVTYPGVSAKFFEPPTIASLSGAKPSWVNCVGTVAASIFPALDRGLFDIDRFNFVD